MFFTPFEARETVQMFSHQRLDIRTITMGINLLDCIRATGENTRDKIYEKICRYAEQLVPVGESISEELGVPIINKRISVTPIALIAASSGEKNYIAFAKTLDKAAKTVGVNFLGGFSALVHKGMTPGDETLIRSIPEALAQTERVCGSVNLGTTKDGINMDAVALMGEVIRQTAFLSESQDGLGAAKLVVFANAVEDNPFMAGAFHGVGEKEVVLNVGVSGPGVIKSALEGHQNLDFSAISNLIKKTAFKITRLGELVGRRASERLGIPFGILDLSLAPTPAVGDSVARIFQELGLEMMGAPGSTAALALLNDAVKKGGIMASSHVGGLSGAFIPVTEDEGMIEAAKCGSLTMEKLEAMTTVCSVGLDMIAIPGDTSAATIAGLIADEAALGVFNNKTTAVRLIPVPGKNAGDWVTFGGLLGEGPIMPVNTRSAEQFIARGGHIPAPVHSFRN
jgi:uncharacterized protein (UPF0210 family)